VILVILLKCFVFFTVLIICSVNNIVICETKGHSVTISKATGSDKLYLSDTITNMYVYIVCVCVCVHAHTHTEGIMTVSVQLLVSVFQ
jgi:hypothetical protein